MALSRASIRPKFRIREENGEFEIADRHFSNLPVDDQGTSPYSPGQAVPDPYARPDDPRMIDIPHSDELKHIKAAQN